MGDDEEVKVEPEKLEEPPKRVPKPKRRMTMSPEAIESRWQAHLEKSKRGGK